MVNEKAKAELEEVRRRCGGFLRPAEVVKFARKKNTELHRYFEWEDTIAAEKWRIRQAQELIRVVVVVNENIGEKVRAFVSLSSDRNAGYGYRASVDVFNDEQLFAVLLEDAKAELASFMRKYEKLREIGELTGVFKEAEKVINKESEIRVSA